MAGWEQKLRQTGGELVHEKIIAGSTYRMLRKNTSFDRFGERFRFMRFFAGWETVTQRRLAGDFPHYQAGSVEHLFFSQQNLKIQTQCFISVFFHVFCLLLCILGIIFVGCLCKLKDTKMTRILINTNLKIYLINIVC